MTSNKKLEINQSQERATERATSGDCSPLIEDGPPGRWANLSPKLKRAIVIGVVVSVILLIALIVLIVVLTGNRCSFSSSPPRNLTPRTVYTVPDVTNLAKFSGYIHVYDMGFIALDIKRMTVQYDNLITLEDDCVTLSIDYSTNVIDPNNTVISMIELYWKFKNGAIGEGRRWSYENWSANVPQFFHSYKTGYHYSCRKREAHKCYKNGPDGKSTAIAQLVIESFELELDGDDETIYKGKFSKPPYPNSCDSFGK